MTAGESHCCQISMQILIQTFFIDLDAGNIFRILVLALLEKHILIQLNELRHDFD